MKTDCECQYCKAKVDVYFCSHCFHNFNKCEAYLELTEVEGDLPKIGVVLCPKCHPKESKEREDIIIRDILYSTRNITE